ncbi:MAG: hypothetical protein QM689_04025 [Oscillospiraceae bacterium]
MLREDLFDLPVISYFEQNNVFSGSCGNHFSYKIFPKERLEVFVWTQKRCFSLLAAEEIDAQAQFEKTEDGLCMLAAWLAEQYQRFGA